MEGKEIAIAGVSNFHFFYIYGQVQAICFVTYGTFRDFKQEITTDEIIYMAIFWYESVAIMG